MLVGLQPLLLLTRCQVPDPYRLVVSRRVQVLRRGVQGQTPHPVVVAKKCVEVLPRRQNKQLYQLVPRPRQQQGLVVVRQPLAALLVQLLQSTHPGLPRELVLQKVRGHQLTTALPLHYQNCLNNVVMGKVTVHRGLLTYVPNYYALVVGTRYHRLAILGHRHPAHPVLVTGKGPFTVAC